MSEIYSIYDMLVLFKAHVRSQIEWCNGAIFHAAPSKLAWLDTIQSSFLQHLDVCEHKAFLDFNLAPMRLRRDIGMLGVLWKVCHGSAHSDFEVLLPRVLRRSSHSYDTRVASRRHDLQLFDPFFFLFFLQHQLPCKQGCSILVNIDLLIS